MATQPVFHLLGGCNGAGKTTFAREFLPTVGVERFLNADEIARGLSPLCPGKVALTAGRILLEELRKTMAAGASFALESTLSGRTYLALLRSAKKLGYSVELHFVWIPSAAEAIKRVRMRVKKGGHHVPAEDIRRRFARSVTLFVTEYAPLADRWRLWDNSSPPAKLLAQSERCSILELREMFSGKC